MCPGGREGAGGSTAKIPKSTTAGRIAVTSNADRLHSMLAKSKPGTDIVTPIAMLAENVALGQSSQDSGCKSGSLG